MTTKINKYLFLLIDMLVALCHLPICLCLFVTKTSITDNKYRPEPVVRQSCVMPNLSLTHTGEKTAISCALSLLTLVTTSDQSCITNRYMLVGISGTEFKSTNFSANAECLVWGLMTIIVPPYRKNLFQRRVLTTSLHMTFKSVNKAKRHAGLYTKSSVEAASLLLLSSKINQLINQSINEIYIAPISPTKPGSVTQITAKSAHPDVQEIRTWFS